MGDLEKAVGAGIRAGMVNKDEESKGPVESHFPRPHPATLAHVPEALSC